MGYVYVRPTRTPGKLDNAEGEAGMGKESGEKNRYIGRECGKGEKRIKGIKKCGYCVCEG